MVRTRRIELPLPCGNRLLRPARLPVPPRPHGRIYENTKFRRDIPTRSRAGRCASGIRPNGAHGRFGILAIMLTGIEADLQAVNERIAAAAERAGRRPDEIRIVAVSKLQSVEKMRLAMSAGVTAFGENRVQEAEDKIDAIGRDAAEWHLIGHLQSNKARRAVELFDVIHSLDSIDLAKRLERICIETGRSELPVFIEVDLAGEATKAGISEPDLDDLVRMLRHCVCLRLDGLMLMPPYFDDPEQARPYFSRLRSIRDRLATEGAFGSRTGELSMGMSHDLEVAVEEGATVVRVGTDIFGSRG